jgi:ABC-type histidine transport system ATPase subunit
MERAGTNYPIVHLFDEPQFNTQDGYIGFMLDFFRKLRSEGRLVFLCVHPNELFHLEILEEICEHFVFVQDGQVSTFGDYASLLKHQPARTYLGGLLEERAA